MIQRCRKNKILLHGKVCTWLGDAGYISTKGVFLVMVSKVLPQASSVKSYISQISLWIEAGQRLQLVLSEAESRALRGLIF